MNIKELFVIALHCLTFNGPKKKNLSNQLSIIGIREGGAVDGGKIITMRYS